MERPIYSQNNLHVMLNSFLYASRILKETATLAQSGLVRHVYIAALHEDGLMESENIDDAREVWRARLRSKKWSRKSAVQLIKYLEFCLRVILYTRKRDIGLVNVHHLALLPLGVVLKWICGARLVYDAHELETETYGLKGLRRVAARYVERTLIKHAELVIVVGNEINRWYREKYGLSNIVTVLNCPEFQEPQRSRSLQQDLSIPEEKRILIYQGGLVRGRGIEKLLRAFAAHDDGRHVLVLMGYGELESMIQGYADSHDNIYLKKAVDPAQVLKYTASADCGISYIDNTCVNDRYCLPNKLFEYIMAGLPVIVNNAPEMQQLVDENKIGIVLDHLTSKSLQRALSELAKMDSIALSKNLKRVAQVCCWNNQALLMLRAYRQNVFPPMDGETHAQAFA